MFTLKLLCSKPGSLARSYQGCFNAKIALNFTRRCLATTKFDAAGQNVAGDSQEESTLAVDGEVHLKHRFISMTRRTLSRKLLEDSNLYELTERLKFQDLAVGLDFAISRGFHGTLGEMKVNSGLLCREARERHSTIHLFKIRGAKVFCCLICCIFEAKILFCIQYKV